MRKLWSILALLTIAATLTACGGDSNAFGTPSSSAATAVSVAKLTVTPAAPTLPPDGTTEIITVTATDANNVAVSGATVTFATSMGTLAVTSATTGATGQATATLAANGVAAGTVITVSATAGGASGKTTVTVAATQQTLTLSTSVPQIASNASSSANITATLLNASNNAVSGATVTFSADSGVINGGPATTDANGKAVVQLSAGQGNYQNRTITVTATSGSSTAQIKVQVVGTSLTLSGPGSLVLSQSGTFTVALLDSGGAGISGQTVTLASANGNTLPATVTTSSTGQATFTFTAAHSGADTITATSLGQAATASVTVSAQSFAFTAPAPSAQIQIGTSATVTVKWTDGSGNPVVGHPISFAATRGTLSAQSVNTLADGTATLTISSSSAGPSTIQATTDTNVSTTDIVDFIATTPNAFSLQASPTTVGLSGQSTITATVRDVNDNLVPNQTVDFVLHDTTQGNLSVASAQTNAQGQATTIYTASNTASATNGVSITGSIPAYPAITAPAVTLTVGGQAVFLSLGTGNTIAVYSPTQFLMPFTVQAVDASGNPVGNLAITFSVKSLGYAKGHWVTGSPWTLSLSTSQVGADPDDFSLSGLHGCQTEDSNGNGVLDAGEDYNGNAVLDPGSVANTATLQGTFGGVTLNQSSTTGTDGTAGVSILYPQDHAAWVAVQVTASATVQGTQSSTATKFWLPMLAADIASATVSPPGVVSPYGVATTCLNPN